MRVRASHGFMGSSLVFCLRCPSLEHFSQEWNSVRARKCDGAGMQKVARLLLPADGTARIIPEVYKAAALEDNRAPIGCGDGCGPARPVVRRRRWMCAGWWR